MTSGAQNIKVSLIDEHNAELEICTVNFAPISEHLRAVHQFEVESLFISCIDPFDNTIFNSLQAPHLISELKKLRNEVESPEIGPDIETLISFIEKVQVHTFVKFQGD
jgi:hypothetical protein